MRAHHPGTKKRIYLDTLREMAYHLYRAWIENLRDQYVLVKAQRDEEARMLHEKTKKESQKHRVFNTIEDCIKQCAGLKTMKENGHSSPEMVQKMKEKLGEIRDLCSEIEGDEFKDPVTGQLINQHLIKSISDVLAMDEGQEIDYDVVSSILTTSVVKMRSIRGKAKAIISIEDDLPKKSEVKAEESAKPKA